VGEYGRKKMLKKLIKLIKLPFFKDEFFVENLVTITAMIVFFVVNIAVIFGLISLWFYIYNL
jgi:hypothetical protein